MKNSSTTRQTRNKSLLWPIWHLMKYYACCKCLNASRSTGLPLWKPCSLVHLWRFSSFLAIGHGKQRRDDTLSPMPCDLCAVMRRLSAAFSSGTITKKIHFQCRRHWKIEPHLPQSASPVSQAPHLLIQLLFAIYHITHKITQLQCKRTTAKISTFPC